MQRHLVGFVAAAAVVVGACSDDDGGDNAATTAEAARSTAVAAVTSSAPTPVSTAPAAPSTTSAPPRSTAAPTPTTTAIPATSPAPPPTVPVTTLAADHVLGQPSVTFTHLGESRSGLLDATAAPVGGLYQVFQDGVILLTTPDGDDVAEVLDISGDVSDGGEQGLLGLAVHPERPLAYIDYTDNNGDTVVAEYAIAEDGTFVGDAARTVLFIEQPFPNHNGGGLAFGDDGYLYITTGDGGGANDPDRRSLDLGDLLGKLLRIDPTLSGDQPYTIPPDNPFVDDPSARPEIWSYGLRNPWRFTFDRATGDLWIADVGQGTIEEIDVARAEAGAAGRGVSFGWSAFEGDNRFNDDQPAEGHLPPVHTYDHADGRCSVSGAAAYRGDRIPELAGGFLFGDYCTGEVWALAMDGSGTLVDLGSLGRISALRVVGDEAYALSLDDGLYRLDPA